MNSNAESHVCHHPSTQNYYKSPKMPVKDQQLSVKTASSFYKTKGQLMDDKTKKILGQCTIHQNLVNSVEKMKQMELMKPKQLNIVGHSCTKDNSNIGSHHSRETNSGYSRNALGGFYTS